MPGVWGNGSWPRSAASGTARCAMLRPGHAAEMAGADLAVSRTAVLDDDFQRDPRCGVARTVLTTRAVAWATSALSYDDTTVSALARHLGVDWHTCWDAVELEAKARTSDPARLNGVNTLGVDEHIWRPSRIGVDRAVTIMVDLSRDQAGCLHARLLDAVVGRSGSV